ncbi:unnamed protein product [Larinioides sclopetarius]|uniref:Glutamate receptor n=1 Tax=Larinioides sclopetarius TaxID=280406 RepID=A0AAV2A2U6_9ARAC
MANQLFNKLSSSGRSFHGILIRPVGIVQRGSTQGISKLTKFSFVNEGSDLLKDLENRWKTLEDWARRPNGKDLPDSALLSHDASRMLHSAFTHLSKKFPETLRASVPSDVDCFNYSSGMPDTAEPFQKNVILGRGVTGNLQFDEQGRRMGYSLNVIESTPFSLNKIGFWSDATGLKLTDRTLPPVTAFQKRDLPIRVTGILTDPFLMRKPDGSLTGYVADFVEQLTLVTGRRFQVQVVKDGYYGIYRDGRWNGMIGELVRNETDLVIADLTKTVERGQAIYFSKSFMTLGLNLVVYKPKDLLQESTTFGPFSFLTVWPAELWLMITFAVALFAAACYGVSRWIGAPDRVRALESKGTDSLSPCGSLWFTMGAILQRDTGIYPRSFTHRVWALLWWAFCFFVLVSYVSALSAALLRNRSHVISTFAQKTSQELLSDLLQKGSPAIGVIQGGSSMGFFVNSNVSWYRDFGRYLLEHPDVPSKSQSEAVQRVRNSGGNYAFVMESITSEFWANRPPCDVLSTPGYFTTRSFAPALNKNSPLKDVIDHAVLTLMENGTLRELYEKWWHNYTDECEDPNMNILPKVYSQSMTLHEVSGVFFVLMALAVISIGTAFVEYYIASSRLSIK